MRVPRSHHGFRAKAVPPAQRAIARQIDSLCGLGVAVGIVEADGQSRAKYLRAVPVVRRRIAQCDLVHAHYGFCIFQ
jgi:hypothetical protein